MRGKEIRVPEGYRGVIVKGDEAERGTDMKNERRMQREEDEEGEVEPKTLREVGSFNEIVLWGHESVVDGDDAFVKGLGEWVGFAEAVSPACLITCGYGSLLARWLLTWCFDRCTEQEKQMGRDLGVWIELTVLDRIGGCWGM